MTGFLLLTLGCLLIQAEVIFSRNMLDKELTAQLLDDYDVTSRPSESFDQPVVISMDIGLRGIVGLTEKTETLRVRGWIRMNWTDVSLRWNASDFQGVDRTEILAKSLWRPDIVLYNRAAGSDFAMTKDEFTSFLAAIRDDGQVNWKFPATIESDCTVDVTYFPFDEQVCDMTFGSWIFAEAQLDINHPTGETDTTVFQENNEWELVSFTVRRNVTEYTDGSRYPELIYRVKLKRRPLYVTFNLILPVSLIAVIGMLTFCLPVDSGEKIGLCVTMLVALSFIMLLLSDKMPPTSMSVPLLGEFFASIVVLLSMTTLLSCFVIHIQFRSDRGRRVPKIVRLIVFKCIARIVCFGQAVTMEVGGDEESNKGTPLKNFKNYSQVDGGDANTPTSQISDGPVMNDIKHKLQQIESALSSRHNPDEDHSLMNREWRMVAMVMDRFFLLVYAISFVGVSLGLLLRRPPNLDD